jgi:hypothetical protein
VNKPKPTTVLLLILSTVAVVVAFFALMEQAFYRRFRTRALEVRAAAGRQSETVISEQDLGDLPEPMARYLRFSGLLGKKRISTARLLHSGKFKPGLDKPWMPIRGEYYLTTKKPSFSWYGKLTMAPGLHAAAFDSYFDGHGAMVVKALSTLTIVDLPSRELDLSAFGRCVTEMTMTPSFFLDRNFVVCSQTGTNQMQCEIKDGPFATKAKFVVGPEGSLEQVTVDRYYDRGNGQMTLEKFTGKASNSRSFGGLVLPSKFDGYWNLPEGDHHYVSFDVDSVEYE